MRETISSYMYTHPYLRRCSHWVSTCFCTCMSSQERHTYFRELTFLDCCFSMNSDSWSWLEQEICHAVYALAHWVCATRRVAQERGRVRRRWAVFSIDLESLQSWPNRGSQHMDKPGSHTRTTPLSALSSAEIAHSYQPQCLPFLASASVLLN